jgi:uncharacterized protein (DUF2147 family)
VRAHSLLVLIFAALAMCGSAIAADTSIEGSWRTQNGTEVTIAPCGDTYCGYLSWVVVPPEYAEQCAADRAAFAAQMLDARNPDPTLQSRPIVGLELMHLRPTGNDFVGDVYNAQDGSTVNNLTVWVTDGGETLRIGGGCFGHMCIGTQDWPRVPTRPAYDFSCTPG